MPAIDSYAIRLRISWNFSANDYILLNSGDQASPAMSLSLYDEMMVPHRRRTVTKSKHRYRFELYFGRPVNIINHFSCRQKAVETVGDLLCRQWCDIDAGPIVFVANT